MAPFDVRFSIGGRNASFVDDWRGETARLLRECAALVEQEGISAGESHALRDVNGNTIGTFTVGK